MQGARYAGAKNLIAVDPLQNKREEAMELGATHAVASIEKAGDLVRAMTNGNGADKTAVTAGIVTEEIVTGAFEATGKAGTVVLTGLNKLPVRNINLPGSIMTLFKTTVTGTLFGDCNPTTDIPKILGLYQSGDLKLDELITRTYTLDQINDGYDDLLNGNNVRGVLIHEHRGCLAGGPASIRLRRRDPLSHECTAARDGPYGDGRDGRPEVLFSFRALLAGRSWGLVG